MPSERMEHNRINDLEKELEDKDKEIKRRNQALDKGTDMTQSLMNSLNG